MEWGLQEAPRLATGIPGHMLTPDPLDPSLTVKPVAGPFCFLKEGAPLPGEKRGPGCPGWNVHQCVQRSFIGLSPLPLPACPSEGSLAAPCPYALLYLFCTPPLGKCPVIWCPLSARCWYDQLTAVHLAHAGDPLLLLCRTSGLGPRHSLGLEQMGGTLQGVDPSAVARPPQPRLLGPPGHFLPCFPKTFSSR